MVREGDPLELQGTPPKNQKEKREGQERVDNTHDHKLEGTEDDAAVRQEKEAHLPEGMSRSVGTVLPQDEDMGHEIQEETPTHLPGGPVLGAEHCRYGQRRNETSRMVPNLGKKRFTLLFCSHKNDTN